jgi:hypothetical protein
MMTKVVPMRLWDYGLVHQAELKSRIARGKDGRTGYEEVTGETPDISEWIDFDFYDLIWYHDPPDLIAETTTAVRKLGRWLGVSNRVGSVLTYWVLTIQHVTVEDRLNAATEEQIHKLSKDINTRLDDTGLLSQIYWGTQVCYKMKVSCTKIGLRTGTEPIPQMMLNIEWNNSHQND